MAFKSRISAITDHTEPSRSALSSRASNTTNVANIKTPVSRLNKSDFARSRSWAPPVSITPESKALESIKERQWKRQPKDQCGPTTKPLLIVDVHDFEIYHAPTTDKRAYELISLHYLEVPVSKKLCFDGFIRVGTVNHYIQAVGIQDCSIEGYGDEENPGIIAYIRSFASSKDQSLEIWYRLRNATPNYQRFHEPFLWVAQLGKHVLDYIEEQPVHSVTLLSFRKAFHSWLTGRFPNNNEFKQWHTAFRQQKDFRIALHAYIEYFYHQAFNLSTSKQLLNQPLWAECMAKGLTFVKPQQEILDYTLATPDVYACFKHMYFGEQIRERCPVRSVQLEQERRKRKLGIAQTPHALGSRNHLHSLNRCQPYGASLVRVGDVVVFTPEKNDGMIWKNTSWDWLAYVQDTQLLDDGTQRLYVLWIYQSCETNIYKAEYPFKNEVFLSDNCNCTEGELLSTDIKGKYNLDWCPPSIEKDRLFIRQTYITQDSAFVSLRDEHKTCVCRKKDVFLHCPGDTVYMGSTLNEEEPLEPVLIHNIHQATGLVTVRRMSRLKRDCAEIATRAHRVDIAPNELVFTDQYETLAMSRIQRRCSVKILTKSDIESNQVPFPYNLGGAGDFWFMAMGLVEANGKQHLVYLQNLPKSFKQGPDVLERSEGTLRGLSIFSGGGSLDRGLEEGGAVKIHTAVDFSAEACHTQRANAQDPENLHIYCGSVDDYLDTVLRGKDQKFIPRVGEVDLIVAGSPCPGFSTLQQDWQSSQSLRNASHISTFCSFIDVYRPLYGILENVVNMSSTRKGYEDQNVLSQVVASLVSMGYQVNQFIMDAWCYSSKQQRSRIILTIAAPGLNPILQPWHTHRRAHKDTKGRSLGMLPNGQRFGEREYYSTPFAYVSAGNISYGLPNIGNSLVQTCIPFPDHRLPAIPSHKDRALLTCIPKNPPGCGYKEAERLGLIPEALKKSTRSDGRPYARIKEAALVPTITTTSNMRDNYNGASVHWDQDRSISILEARRAQGYPDDEPIIGKLKEQYKIVGNGVDRKVAFAMGLSLSQAIEKNASDFAANGMTPSASEMYSLADDTEDEKNVTSALSQEHRYSGSVAKRDSEYLELDVDRPSETSPRTSTLSQTDTVQEAPGLRKRLSQHFTNSIGRLSLQSPSKNQTLSILTKRRREPDTGDEEIVTVETSSPSERPGKRAKPSRKSQSSAVTAGESHRKDSMSSSGRSASSSAQ
ncbi:Dcm Site-specific DNA methylase [Pyrenophora tritici-repentis]|nr:Dcm Site-specific DNA methylase [Pyrenophora tritici-repentis]